jgi:hypothetical protein
LLTNGMSRLDLRRRTITSQVTLAIRIRGLVRLMMIRLGDERQAASRLIKDARAWGLVVA